MTFDHFVLTRFNVRIPGRDAASDEWLTRRLSIMRQTMLPSMRSQTVRPTAWIVYCDAGSPQWFRDEITEALDGVGEPEWLGIPSVPEDIGRMAAESVRVRARNTSVITTRVDNDDCISKQFVARIQQSFDGSHNTFINFTHGVQYERGWVFHRSDPSNAFISMFERSDQDAIRTVYLDGHHLLKNHGTIRQLREKPVWMQVVHGDNIANTVHGVRTDPKIVGDFVNELPLNAYSGLGPRLLAFGDTVRLGLRVLAKPHRLIWLWKSFAGK